MVLDQVSNAVDAAMQRAAVRTVGRAEVQATGALAEPRHVQGMIHQLADTLVAGSANGNNGHAQQALEQVDVYGAAVGGHLIMLSAMTMGRSSSISCNVRYRLRSMLVASMMSMMASGRSSRMN